MEILQQADVPADVPADEVKKSTCSIGVLSADVPADEVKKSTCSIGVLSEDAFHVGDDVEKIPWGKLTSDIRSQKLKEYLKNEFNHSDTEKTISSKDMGIIIDIVEKGKLNHKKEVSYDETNQRIIKLYVLAQEQHGNNYIYKPEKISVRERSKKSAKLRLFRKNR
jgi:hypothetical protein